MQFSIEFWILYNTSFPDMHLDYLYKFLSQQFRKVCCTISSDNKILSKIFFNLKLKNSSFSIILYNL